MSLPIITAEGLSKAYRIGLKENAPTTLVGAALQLAKSPLRNLRRLHRLNTYSASDDQADTYWALKDVSFEISEGEVVGIIGRNGAGKSTLLKLLSRITDPTSGRAILRGRVSSLLEVGTGFHPELTGRENVYLNGTILGMTTKEVDRKFDEIVDFSGVEKFLDTPIKRYSSGMTVRLAFAVAAHLEPEILIIDEVLAVGDAEFQKKCLGKMKDVAKGGRTVLFVSHSISAVRALCHSGVLLRRGQVACRGPIETVLQEYLSAKRDVSTSRDINDSRRNSKAPCIQDVRILDEQGQAATEINQGENITIEVAYSSPSEIYRVFKPMLGVVLKGIAGDFVGGISMNMTGTHFTSPQGEGLLRCTLKSPPLVQGQYAVDVYLQNGLEPVDMVEEFAEFHITPMNIYGSGMDPLTSVGNMYFHADWGHEQPDTAGRTAKVAGHVSGRE
jgi:lipopolysaccharide transport system ATP-binding protein